MYKSIRLLVAGSVLSAISLSAFAELLVVITPTRTEKSYEDVNPQVEVIGREEIVESQANTVTELIATRAGVEIGRNGGDGQQTSVFIRGAESDHTLVLINGVNMGPDLGQAAIQNINPDLIERIEIVKGARSSQYGSHAVGGVINIITRDAATGVHGNVGVKAGRYDTTETTAGVSYGGEVLQAGIDVAAKAVAGPSAQDVPPDEDEYENTAVNAFVSAKASNGSITLRHFQSDGTVEYDSFSSDQEQDFTNQVSSLTGEYTLGSAVVTATLSRAEDELEQQVPNFLSELDFARTVRDTAGLQVDYTVVKDQTLTVGLEAVEEAVDALSFGTSIDDNNDREAVFVQYDATLGRHYVLLAARQSEYDSFGGQTTGGAEYAFAINEQWKLLSGVNTAFRAPSLTDRFGFGGNPDLKPEEAVSSELGVSLVRGAHQFKWTAFNTVIEDLVTFTPAFTLENVDEAEISGLEIGYDYTAGGISSFVDVVLQEAENKETDERLLRRASFMLKAGTTYRSGRWGWNANVAYNGKRDDFGDVRLDPYTVLNAAVSYEVVKNMKISVSGKNIGDVDYQVADGFNMPKAAYYGEVKYTF